MAESIWVKVKGGRLPIRLPTTGLQDVFALIEMVKNKATPLLDNVPLVQLQLYQSEETTEESLQLLCCFQVPCRGDRARHDRL